MLKGQDVLVLLRLLDQEEPVPVRALAGSIELDVAGTHRALSRLTDAGLYQPAVRRAPRQPAEEFLVHAVKYLFPARRGAETRGIPTAWAAPPLRSKLAPTDELPPVWPDPHGSVRGLALEPLHPAVPKVATHDGRLAETLALVDALRAGDARIRELAASELVARVREPA